MTAPSIGVKDLLVTAGVGVFAPTTGTWQIYISKMPDKQDRVITLYDSGGLAPWPRSLLDFPNVSVNVRGQDYADAYDKMKAIKDALLGLPPQIINGDSWSAVTQVGEMAFAGYDEKDRPLFSATFRLFIEPADTAGNYRDAI